MKINFTQPLKVYKTIYQKDFMIGREWRKLEYSHDIQGHVDESSSSLQVEIYGDRIKNIFTILSNDDIAEDCEIEYKGNMYKIIGKKSTSIIQPIHYIYELELK